MVGSVRLLVVQPTPFCNLDCDYCYLPDRGDRSRLSFPVLEAAVERVLDSPYFGGEFTLLWHAGEPLMAPIAFYDEATERIRQLLARRGLPPSKIVQSLQTNATVIDAAWCHCFERNGIHVGVSMDGPAFLHYAHRVTRTGLPRDQIPPEVPISRRAGVLSVRGRARADASRCASLRAPCATQAAPGLDGGVVRQPSHGRHSSQPHLPNPHRLSASA
ncbi:MAG: hypothetical protein O2977_02605 [Cyanobacteria bacterium]|jgi:hypothetical protein|nr:hypothetical protein [Cyanobacteriota bacterium]MDA1205342.1 hypothetical protein [Cyanobacteriota bacterium]